MFLFEVLKVKLKKPSVLTISFHACKSRSILCTSVCEIVLEGERVKYDEMQ